MTDPDMTPGERRAATLYTLLADFVEAWNSAARATHAPRHRGGDAWRPPDPRYPSITCPACGATSYHPDDKRHGWCARCNAYTSPPGGNPPAPVS